MKGCVASSAEMEIQNLTTDDDRYVHVHEAIIEGLSFFIQGGAGSYFSWDS